MKMYGIDLNNPIAYENASLRFFMKNEHHVTRFCKYDVLLLVYEGVLRFSENGVEHEVHPGEYYIQKSDTFQKGNIASDAPKYLYVHFNAQWTDTDTALPFQGEFNCDALKPDMEALNQMSHGDATYIEQTAKFYEILSALYKKKTPPTLAAQIEKFLSQEYLNALSLEKLCRQFSFSKNHIINVFKEAYHVTPFEYINDLKLKRTEYLLEVTSENIESIAYASGFNNYSQFYRLFFRKHRMSPKEWRNIKRIQNM